MPLDGTREHLKWLEPGRFGFHYHLNSGRAKVDCAYHWHPCVELLWWEKASGIQHFAGTDFQLRDGLFSWINAYVPHNFVIPSENRIRVHVFQFNLAPLSSVSDAVRPVVNIQVDEDPAISALLKKLHSEVKRKKPHRESMLKGLFLELASLLARQYPASRKKGRGQESIEAFRPVISYLEDNWTEGLSTRDAARMAHFSEGAFCRKFKSAFGVTFLEFVNHRRVDFVKKELLAPSSHETISSIAMRAGFSDVKYFNQVFKKLTGLTPTSFRSKYTQPA